MQGTLSTKKSFRAKWNKFVSTDEFSALVPLVLLLFVVQLIKTVLQSVEAGQLVWGSFLSWDNIRTVLNLVPFIGICCLGNALVIMTSSADMSVGTTAGFSCIVLGWVIKTLGMPWWVGILAGLLTGLLLGWIKAYFILDLNLPSFIVTLGLSQIIASARYFLSGGYQFNELGMKAFGEADVFGLYYAFFIALLLYVIVSIMLAKTTFGRKIKAVGDNPEVAALSGINVVNIKKFAYLASGVIVAISGLLMAIRLDLAAPTNGTGWETNCIAACAIGGVSLSGGKGSGLCIAMGMMTMMFLTSAFYQFPSLPTQLEGSVIGIFLMVAASLDMIKSRQKVKAEDVKTFDDEEVTEF